MRFFRHPFIAGVSLSLILAGVLAAHRLGWQLPISGPFLEKIERLTLDARFKLRGPISPGDETVILAYDDATLASAPELFERRAGWAKVLRALSAAGAKAVGIDAFFDRPEELLDAGLVQDIAGFLQSVGAGPLQDAPATALLHRVFALTQGDPELEASIREAGNVVLAVYLGSYFGGEVDDQALGKGVFGQAYYGSAAVGSEPKAMASLPRFNEAAAALGTVNTREDGTNSVRNLPMATKYHDRLYASLSTQLASRLLGLERKSLVFLGQDRAIGIGKGPGGRILPLDVDLSIPLNYRGPGGTFPTVSVADLVGGRVPVDRLRGKIVLVGMTYLGHDKSRTPYDPYFPSVELHATAIDNILRGDFLRRTAGWLDGLLCLALGVLVSLLYWPRLGLRPWMQVGGSVVLLLGYLGGSLWAFSRQQLWLSWIGPILVFLLCTLAGLLLSYLGEGLRHRRLNKLFGHFLAPEVIADLAAHPDDLVPGGEKRQSTVLFSDIRGFTSLAEEMAPDRLVAFLNAYFKPMARTVMMHGGYLDKYIGDAVMAIFGAPRANPEHPRQALRCVLDMHRELVMLQSAPALEGHALAIGVGVNTGEMVVGLMGSEHYNYTAVGDAVNLASRLESLTKTYGVFCLVGDTTRKVTGTEFLFREVDLVRVKGKYEAVAIHEFLGGPGSELAAYREMDTFLRGLEAYRSGRFQDARSAFTHFAGANPQDRLAPLYLERLAVLGYEPPPGWDGVFVHLQK